MPGESQEVAPGLVACLMQRRIVANGRSPKLASYFAISSEEVLLWQSVARRVEDTGLSWLKL